MNDNYVLLTGSKNNAGDFLIKHRAKQLFSTLRPDRSIIDIDRWNELTSEQLTTINSSKALILMGGPALQQNFYSGIYPLTSNLADIKVPIIMMGLGYKEHDGSWEKTSKYKLSDSSIVLLKRIDSNGYQSSVRDYHTLNVLLNKGIKNVIMTGCPALFDINYLAKAPVYPNKIKTIGFSLGVSYIESQTMDLQMKQCILKIKEYFNKSELTAYFHHSIYQLSRQQMEMVQWLKKNKINYKDISGSADNLIKAYSGCDLHIGYRVHSHIFSSSISKPSVLFAEDSRGRALQRVLGGLVLDACFPRENTFAKRISSKLGIYIEKYSASKNLLEDTILNLENEIKNGFPRMLITRKNIDLHFEQMKKFISQLP